MGSATGGISGIDYTLANNGDQNLCCDTGKRGLVILYDRTNDQTCVFALGSSGYITEIADPNGVCSTTSGTASNSNYYHYSAGDFHLENKRGVTVTYSIFQIGGP